MFGAVTIKEKGGGESKNEIVKENAGRFAKRLYRGRVQWYGCGMSMSETAVTVAEAARDFLRVLERVEREREPAVLVREGKPVATLSPLPRTALTCTELSERWPKLEKLPPDEANAFADAVELARSNLPPLKPAWD